MNKIYDTVIIGGGPAGYSAALYASRAGLDTLIIEKLSPGGQMGLTGDIDNYPGFDEGIDGFTLGMKMQNGAHRFGARTEYAEVLSVGLFEDPKRITTSSGDFFALTVIIATGADPKKLGVPKEDTLTGKGVHYCAHCDGRFYKGKNCIVVGGGNSAAADALYLSRLANKVYLVHRRDTLRAEKVYHEPLKNTKNVEFIWNSTLLEIIENGRPKGALIKNVQTEETHMVEADGIFISIGRSPATAFLKDSGILDKNGYIIADETTKTSVPGVFAAGDVRTKALRQVVTAAADGAVSAHFAEEYITERKGEK